MNLKPLSDRVILKALEAEEKTKGGIILTTSTRSASSALPSTPVIFTCSRRLCRSSPSPPWPE